MHLPTGLHLRSWNVLKNSLTWEYCPFLCFILPCRSLTCFMCFRLSSFESSIVMIYYVQFTRLLKLCSENLGCLLILSNFHQGCLRPCLIHCECFLYVVFFRSTFMRRMFLLFRCQKKKVIIKDVPFFVYFDFFFKFYIMFLLSVTMRKKKKVWILVYGCR